MRFGGDYVQGMIYEFIKCTIDYFNEYTRMKKRNFFFKLNID